MEVPLGFPTTSSGQRQWATPEMWQSHRVTIVELYKNHTLKEMMKIMEDKHKFFATIRMYKSHISKWGLQKHFRAKQVQALLHQKAERDATQKASSMYIRGNKVDSKKLQAYINRTSKQNKDRISTAANGGPLSPSAQRLMAAVVACRTPSPVQSFEKRRYTASHRGQRSNNETDLDTEKPLGSRFTWLQTTPPQTLLLSASDAHARTEKCMRCLRDYVADNFESGRWSDDLDERGRVELDQVIDWANIFDDALRFLQREQNQQGFRLVQICFGQYKALLSAGSIRLFFSIYPIFIQLQHYPDLARKMIGYASKMSETIHSTAHPFTALWREFLAMDHDEIRLNWKPLINCYSSFIAEQSNDDSELMFEAVRARNGNIRCQTLDGLVDFNLAEELFQKDITTWENYTHTSSPETVCLKRGLSTFYAIHQRYDDLERIITEIAPWSRPSYLHMLAVAAVDQGDFVQAVELYDAWLTWSKDEFGAGHDEIACACICLENLLRDIGDMEQADIVGKQSEIILDALCVRLGEMEIQETCDEEGLDGNEADLTSSSLNGFDILGDSLTYQGGKALGSVGEDAMGRTSCLKIISKCGFLSSYTDHGGA
ncbi:uncharacterized protein NECHADRAFT_82215 [Fusarium vanettenii 77-13-4]|uniref:Clr5 domain-containing protein n=1 Tax=Fusarium vanettenii (strain ATCC MYA-4622 / CBS 123669 / FGSC 9596 / NRRL 45880 / 77-13-4) TaxID=660122 RepID=C7ZJS3_FUSV7|nr:uncharacterized protein NECHADRAFT_82215 [Fusarium vanettenii 77-13-4]EEU35754.1 predicted protein [Fusarium vanettenii 77-13-4]